MGKTKIHYFTHLEIDKKKWDECIHQSSQGLVYALSFYLDIVSPNWDAVIEENEQAYTAVMPLPKKRKYGITFLQQPLFCQQLGIFSVENEVSNAKLEIFMALIVQKYKLASHYHFHTNVRLSQTPNMEITYLHTHHLNLSCSYTAIYKNYSADRKLNLKLAIRANLQIVESADIEPLIQMFEKDIAHKISGGVAANAYDMLKKLYKALHKKGLCKLFYTKNQKGQIGAGGLFVFYQHQIIYLFNAAYHTHRKENGRTLLIDHLLKKYAQSSYTFDFESPEIVQISQFYKSFGAEAIPYPKVSYNHLPDWINNLWKVKKKIYETIFPK
ncbi:MAG: GNAT family N-acetyltransferase [Cytophagales bacterium]|nr:MAG: GNAT family N-acetyltransferase [Cytophagales bacterium]